MSRKLEIDRDYQYVETIDSLFECKHMVNELCNCPFSKHVNGFVSRDICAYCDFFVDEDGIIVPRE